MGNEKEIKIENEWKYPDSIIEECKLCENYRDGSMFCTMPECPTHALLFPRD